MPLSGHFGRPLRFFPFFTLPAYLTLGEGRMAWQGPAVTGFFWRFGPERLDMFPHPKKNNSGVHDIGFFSRSPVFQTASRFPFRLFFPPLFIFFLSKISPVIFFPTNQWSRREQALYGGIPTSRSAQIGQTLIVSSCLGSSLPPMCVLLVLDSRVPLNIFCPIYVTAHPPFFLVVFLTFLRCA